MLEKMKPDYYQIDLTYCHYNLRQPGITIPGVGFDEGTAKGNGWGRRFGNAFSYRTETGMKMPLRPGKLPPSKVVVPTGEALRKSDPLTDLCLELEAGEEASYTIRDVKTPCTAEVVLRCMEETTLEIVCTEPDKETAAEERQLTPGDTAAAFSRTGIAEQVIQVSLEPSSAWVVTLRVKKGRIQIDEVRF